MYIAVAEDAVKVTKGVAESILRYVDGASESKALVQVISAFAAPNIRYDHIRKTFYKDTSRRELVGCGAEVSIGATLHMQSPFTQCCNFPAEAACSKAHCLT